MGGVEDITDYDITDQDGHGTMLAGSILATANSVSDIEIMAVKFFDVRTQPVAVNAAQAIRFAVKNGAQIMNLSFDLGIGSIELEEAIRSACAAGVLVVIAAGNTGSDNDCYPLVPALYARVCRDNVIVVMASGQYDEKPTFSNFGKETVDLAAPGVKIESTRRFLSSIPPSKIYSPYTGTSAAAAQVTGAAALLKSQNPDWKAKDLKACLMETVDKLPGLKCVNGGRLNLGRALSHRPSTLELSLANPPFADVAQGDLVAQDRESRRRRRTGRRET
jgi:subtilisin family serine protease